MSTVITIASVYMASCIASYFLLRISYSKGGRWEGVDAGLVSVAVILCPIVNTLVTLWLMFNGARDKTQNTKRFNSFFKIKK